MDKLFSNVTSIEGLIGTAATLAFVLVFWRAAKGMLSEGGGENSTVKAIGSLIGAIKENTEVANQQARQFEANNTLFAAVVGRLEQVHDTLKDIERSVK